MSTKEAIEILQYLRHNFVSGSPYDNAVLRAIEALEKENERNEADY